MGEYRETDDKTYILLFPNIHGKMDVNNQEELKTRKNV
jgi:hypothetical protein